VKINAVCKVMLRTVNWIVKQKSLKAVVFKFSLIFSVTLPNTVCMMMYVSTCLTHY